MREYVARLRAGEVLACPTETQLGLLADARNADAVERVCAMKRRPSGEALPVIVPSLEHVLELGCELPANARALALRYWPGPLSLVLRVPDGALAPAVIKGGTVALRVPGPSPALELVRAFGGVLTATSANLSGQPPLARAAELRATFGAALGAIVPGNAPGGAPSTLVDMTGERPRVIRQGAIVVEF